MFPLMRQRTLTRGAESKDNVLQRDVQAKHITYYEFGVSSCFEGVDLLPGMVQVDAGVRHQDVPQNKFDAHVAAAKAASTARYASAGSTPVSLAQVGTWLVMVFFMLVMLNF